MAKNQVDPIDLAAIVLVPIAAAMEYGVFSLSVDVFGGYDFSQALFTVGGTEISIPLVVIIGGLAWIVATNEIDGSDYENWEYVLIGGSFSLPILVSFVPLVETLVFSYEYFRVAGTLAISAAAAYIAYTE